MKKIKFQGKLSLNKETVARLNDAQMNEVKGGAWFTLYHCKSKNCASDNCPTRTCPTGSCGHECTGPANCPTILQTACNGNACA